MCSNRFLLSSSGRAGTGMSWAVLACLFGLHRVAPCHWWKSLSAVNLCSCTLISLLFCQGSIRAVGLPCVRTFQDFAVCAALVTNSLAPTQNNKHAGVLSACCCVEVLGIPGCGAFNCLEEMWEERCYRKKRKEGGRAQYGAGIFERNSFTLTSSSAQGRTVWMCRSDYLSGVSSAHKYLFFIGC